VIGGVQVITVMPAPEATVTPPPPFPSMISCAAADVFSAPDVHYNNGVTGTCNISGTISASIDNSNWGVCGGTLIVTYMSMDECNRTVALPPYHITVMPAPEATVNVPFVPSSISCVAATTYNAPTASYSNGLIGTCGISGSINPHVTPNFDKCGGTITITYGINPPLADQCGRPITATRVISVLPAPAPTVMPPSFPSQVTCAEGVP